MIHGRDEGGPKWTAPKRTGPTGISPDESKSKPRPATEAEKIALKQGFKEVPLSELQAQFRPRKR